MIRCMMLALTLMLITLSAAYLGRDEQLRQVLRQTRVPVEAASQAPAKYDDEPPAPSSPPAVSQEESPRFVPDEPLILPSSSDVQPVAPPPAPLPIDPSTEARLYAVESEERYTPSPPTEEQKLAAAEPYVKELFELTERSSAELRSLADDVIGEYLAISPSERSGSLAALAEKYLPLARRLEADSDSEAEAILLRMTAALTAIGADDGLVTDARAAYQRTKQQQIEHYTSLFDVFSP